MFNPPQEIHANAGGYAASYYNAVFNNNQSASILWRAGGNWMGAGVRLSDSGGVNWYAHFSDKTIRKCVAGVDSILHTHAFALVQDDRIGISVTGTTITYLINDVVKGTWSDSSLASGKAGIVTFNNNANGDDWIGADLAAAFIPFPYPRGLYGGLHLLDGGIS